MLLNLLLVGCFCITAMLLYFLTKAGDSITLSNYSDQACSLYRSFYEQWKEPALELTDLQKMDELHACQTLLVIFANGLRRKPLDLQVLSPLDVERSGVYEWEKSIISASSV